MSHASVAADVRRNKEMHPENYCANPKCLWRRLVWTKSGEVVKPCPKHETPHGG